MRHTSPWLAGIVLIAQIQIAQIQTIAMGEIIPKPAHRASRLDGWKVLDSEAGRLRLEVLSPGKGLLVLFSSDPVTLERIEGADANLRPGWDGTIEYSHYALELSAQAPGYVSVQLAISPPPATPRPTTSQEMAEFQEKLRHRTSRPPNEPKSFLAWQRDHRKRLANRLFGGHVLGGQSAPPQATELRLEQSRPTNSSGHSKFELRRVEYHVLPDRKSTLLLSLPKGVEKAPLLIALHGHEAPWGKADELAYVPGHNDDFIAYFAARGWAVLQPATMNHTLQNPSWTLQGEWTWDAMVALDYASTLPEIDMERVAVCGLSTGGHLAMNMLALDKRVKAGVVGCILSTWNHYEKRCRLPPHCDCGIHAQMSPIMEQCDWAALAAPKPVLFQHGKQDASYCPDADEKYLHLDWNTGIMPGAEYDSMFREVRRTWHMLGHDNMVETQIHPDAHRVDNTAAFKWLTAAFEPSE